MFAEIAGIVFMLLQIVGCLYLLVIVMALAILFFCGVIPSLFIATIVCGDEKFNSKESEENHDCM